MTNIQVKNVDPVLHEALRQRAAAAGHTLGEYLLELIRRDLRRPGRREWLERAARLTPIEPDRDTAELLHASREERTNR